MSRRTKIIITVIVLLLLIALALWLLLRPQGGPADVNDALQQPIENVNAPTALPGSSTTVDANPTPAVNAPVTAPVVETDPALALKRLAMSFAERYGSFSSLGDYSNMSDLEPFMSAAFVARTEAFVAAELAKPPQTEYRGYTTRALSATTESLDESAGNAVITVKTQRQEFTDPTKAGTVSYRDIRLTFIKENGTWKVDTATWQ